MEATICAYSASQRYSVLTLPVCPVAIGGFRTLGFTIAGTGRLLDHSGLVY